MKLITPFIFIAIIFIVLINTSCSKDNDYKSCKEHDVSICNEDSTKINIRISNVSEYDFCNVVLRNVNCGLVKQGQSTCYRAFDSGYRYDFVELEIDGNIYTIQPIDYVGELPLEKGFYSYQINANNSNKQYEKLSLTFAEE